MGGIDLDPASCREANAIVGAADIFTIQDDALAQRWEAQRVYMNPPYGDGAGYFVAHLLREVAEGRVHEAVVCLNSNSQESRWFQPLWDHTLCFTRGRVDFIYGGKDPDKANSSNHGTVFIYIGPNDTRFVEVFSRFGNVVRRVTQTPAAAVLSA